MATIEVLRVPDGSTFAVYVADQTFYLLESADMDCFHACFCPERLRERKPRLSLSWSLTVNL